MVCGLLEGYVVAIEVKVELDSPRFFRLIDITGIGGIGLKFIDDRIHSLSDVGEKYRSFARGIGRVHRHFLRVGHQNETRPKQDAEHSPFHLLSDKCVK